MAASNVDASTTSVGVFDAGDPEELAPVRQFTHRHTGSWLNCSADVISACVTRGIWQVWR